MDLRPGYKLTEAGAIPDDWEYRPIAEVARLESGHTPSKRIAGYWNGDVPWVSLHDTQALERNELHTTAKSISEAGLQNSSARLLPAGTVVFSRTATVGKASIIGRPMATSQDFANYICGPKLHNRYLVYLLRGMKSTWRQLMAGSIHNTIYMPAFEALKIVCPPLDEQVAIADALSEVDALLDGLRRLAAKKRHLKQAAMQQLLAERARLPGFTEDWQTLQLADVGDLRSGGTPSTSQPQFWDDGVLWCTPTDITALKGSKYLAATARTLSFAGLKASAAELIPARSLIMTTRATIGECAINAVPMATNQGFKNIVPFEGFNVEYLYYFMSTQKARLTALCGGSTFLEIGKKQLLEYTIRIPRDPGEQTAIATVLSDLDAELAALEARLEKTKALKQAMMQELLSGRTRLVTPEPAHA